MFILHTCLVIPDPYLRICTECIFKLKMHMSASESIKVVSIRYTYYAATSKNLFTILEMSAGVYLMYLPVFLAKSTLTYLS